MTELLPVLQDIFAYRSWRLPFVHTVFWS